MSEREAQRKSISVIFMLKAKIVWFLRYCTRGNFLPIFSQLASASSLYDCFPSLFYDFIFLKKKNHVSVLCKQISISLNYKFFIRMVYNNTYAIYFPTPSGIYRRTISSTVSFSLFLSLSNVDKLLTLYIQHFEKFFSFQLELSTLLLLNEFLIWQVLYKMEYSVMLKKEKRRIASYLDTIQPSNSI